MQRAYHSNFKANCYEMMHRFKQYKFIVDTKMFLSVPDVEMKFSNLSAARSYFVLRFVLRISVGTVSLTNC